MQRYTVFLNERAVTILQDINNHPKAESEMVVVFDQKSNLREIYKRFISDSDCSELKIFAGHKFDEACLSFNSLFRRVEAAGGIVKNEKNETLFIKRFGRWDLPKGKLHKNETIAECALREVNEETGITGLSIGRQLASTHHIFTDRHGRECIKETYWFAMLCKLPQQLTPQLEEDITEVRWFNSHEVADAVSNTYASLKPLMKEI